MATSRDHDSQREALRMLGWLTGPLLKRKSTPAAVSAPPRAKAAEPRANGASRPATQRARTVQDDVDTATSPDTDPFAGLRERGLVFLDDPTPADELPRPAQATELLAQLAAHEAVADSPDALALLELLSGGADTIIRQLPAAARAGLALCDDPDITRRDLAEKLSTDPALVQSLLRTANSAAFGAGKSPVMSIAPALDRIGIGGARSIIFANAVDGALSRPGGELNEMVTSVWNHMVSTAPLARALAPAFAVDPEEAFTIALLHDVGKLVIFDRISHLRSTQRRDPQLSATFLRDLLNHLHELLGAAAMHAWSMGDRPARAIGSHHRRTNDLRTDPLAEVIFLAESVDHTMRRGKPVELRQVWFEGRLTASDTAVADILSSYGAVVK